MRISDWSSDVCSSYLRHHVRFIGSPLERIAEDHLRILRFFRFHARFGEGLPDPEGLAACAARANDLRSEEHTSELQSLMRISYAVFCLTTKRLSKKMVGSAAHGTPTPAYGGAAHRPIENQAC